MTTTTRATGAESFGVSNRIQAKLPQMSAAMAKIATLLLTDPTAPLELSITELAEQAGTSAATVTRFCRLIGYSGYVPFRVGVAADVGRGTAQETWRADIGRAFDPNDSPADVMRALLNAHTISLQATADSADLVEIERVAVAVASCTHLDIYGIGGSAGMAEELQSRLYRIGINSHAWPEVHIGLTSAALQGEDCVAIGISNTGRTEETIQMLSKAKSAGAYAVAVTNSADSPLADVADVHLMTFAPDEYLQPDDLSAKHSQLFMLDLLYLLVAQQNFARTATMLAASAMAVAPHRRSSRASRRNPLAPGASSTSSAANAAAAASEATLVTSVAASAAAPSDGEMQKGHLNA